MYITASVRGEADSRPREERGGKAGMRRTTRTECFTPMILSVRHATTSRVNEFLARRTSESAHSTSSHALIDGIVSIWILLSRRNLSKRGVSTFIHYDMESPSYFLRNA